MLKGYLLANITDDDGRAQASDTLAELLYLGKDEDADCIKAWLRSQYADKIRERRARANPEDFDRLGTEFHRWVRENSLRTGLTSSASRHSSLTISASMSAPIPVPVVLPGPIPTDSHRFSSTRRTVSPCNIP